MLLLISDRHNEGHGYHIVRTFGISQWSETIRFVVFIAPRAGYHGVIMPSQNSGTFAIKRFFYYQLGRVISAGASGFYFFRFSSTTTNLFLPTDLNPHVEV